MIRPFGDSALLVEVAALADVLDLHARLAGTRPAGVVDLVPAARTVLVHVDPAVLPLATARAWITGTDAAPGVPADAAPAPDEVEVPVVYDGADLAETASLLGLSTEQLIARHLAARWTVAFTGFAPGFGYLVSDDWDLDVPRRATPRTRVPSGAVALAGRFSGAYPRDTPGGWQLIGTTDAPLFEPGAPEPVLLRPGTRVRFRRAVAATVARTSRPAAPAGPVAFRVTDPGALTTVQDAGRPGRLADGVARSGAADQPAFAAANRLVGNPVGAAVLEIALGGFRAVAERDLWIAATGAWAPIRVGGRDVDPYRPVQWPAGAELTIGIARAGIRVVLAVRGGIAAADALGSAATDTLAGIGAEPLRAGDEVATADAARHPVPPIDSWPWTPPPDVLVVDVAAGPRADWFTPAARQGFLDTRWIVDARADRVGIRLDGPPLERTADAAARELPSEGMLPGAVQVPPDGRPVILGPDGPVTGGYPVIAVVTAAGRAALAQARPGSHLLLRSASPRL